MKEQPQKQNFLSCLLTYASESKPKMIASVILSVISITSGLIPFYCFYRIIGLFMESAVTTQDILFWSLGALAAYIVKIVCFGLSTTASHYAAYHILEGLRNRVTERFLKAPLGEVTRHSIGEIKEIMVDKIEDIEPPLAHMIPESCGHIVLPVVSMIALAAALFLGANGTITAAQAALAVMLSMSMVGSLAKLEVMGNEVKRIQLTVEELQEYLEMPELPEKEDPVKPQNYNIELKDVHFSYEDTEVLHGIDLALPQGSFTALVGPSCGGKSTVAKLISRFYDVTKGSVFPAERSSGLPLQGHC